MRPMPEPVAACGPFISRVSRSLIAERVPAILGSGKRGCEEGLGASGDDHRIAAMEEAVKWLLMDVWQTCCTDISWGSSSEARSGFLLDSNEARAMGLQGGRCNCLPCIFNTCFMLVFSERGFVEFHRMQYQGRRKIQTEISYKCNMKYIGQFQCVSNWTYPSSLGETDENMGIKMYAMNLTRGLMATDCAFPSSIVHIYLERDK